MIPSITATDFMLEQYQHEIIENKLRRIKYVEEWLVDLTLRIKLDKKFIFRNARETFAGELRRISKMTNMILQQA